MKHSTRPQSATSLPPAPRDEASARMTKYFVMMSVRVACFLLMVLVTPYGWYTWLFALGAIVLPYLAVVVANVGADAHETRAETPGRALTTGPDAPAAPPAPPTQVIRMTESGSEPGDRRATER